MAIEINDLNSTDKVTAIISDLENTEIEDIEVSDLNEIPLIKGKSAYEIALINGFEGTEAEWLNSLKIDFQKTANEFLEEAESDEGTRQSNEITRQSQEQTRNETEQSRITSEQTRQTNESTRQEQETVRQASEQQRISEFNEMKTVFNTERITNIESNIATNSRNTLQNTSNILELQEEQTRQNSLIQANTNNISQNTSDIEEIENKITKTSLIKSTEQIITKNTNYEIPEYTKLEINYEGCKLIKDINYIEVDSTHIQFKDWDVPVGSNIEFLYS